MRILIIGGDGMLGHRLLADLSVRHDVVTTIRRRLAAHPHAHLFDPAATYDGVDVRDLDRVQHVVEDAKPQVIVNAAGIVKQRDDAKQAVPSIEVNSLFPHRLAAVAAATGARVVHVSTDCVFSGRQGHYTETDTPDPVDLYGRSKLLGEIADSHCLTLRTSIIGLALDSRLGLVEWALSQTGEIRGFTRAIYTGVTTAELARIVDHVVATHREPRLHGVWHVASQPITKYELLVELFRRVGKADVRVLPDDQFTCDRSLDGSAFEQAAGYRPSTWGDMLDELAGDVVRRKADAA